MAIAYLRTDLPCASSPTLTGRSELATLCDENGKPRLTASTDGDVLNLPDHQHGRWVKHLTEDHMLVVQPVALVACDEELAPVGVRTTVGHGEQARLVVLEHEVL